MSLNRDGVATIDVDGHSLAAQLPSTGWPAQVAAALGYTLSLQAVAGTIQSEPGHVFDGWANVYIDHPRSGLPVTSLRLPRMLMAWTGINDIAYYGPTDFPARFAHALRALISRHRQGPVFESGDATVSPDVNWSAQSGSTHASADNYHRTATNGADITINVPSDFPGGTFVAGLVTNTGQGALHTITVDGVVHGTIDTRSIASNWLPCLYRIRGLDPGAHTIVVEATTVSTFTYFDYWAIEPELPEPVVLMTQYKPNSYAAFPAAGYPFTPTDADVAALNAIIYSVAEEFGDQVLVVDTEPVIAGSTTLIGGDGLHIAQAGHDAVALAVLAAIGSIGEEGYDVYLGRLKLTTITDGLKEQLGDSLETVGAAVVAGDRRARGFPLSFYLDGPRDAPDPYAETLRIRRQLRALLENPKYRLPGLYFRFGFDEEQNGWLIVGGGDIDYSEGGISLGDFKCELSDVFRLGGQRTLRPARRLQVLDRRGGTVARDYYGEWFSTDFSAVPLSSAHFLPVGAVDLLNTSGELLSPGRRLSRDGFMPVLGNRPHADVVSFEQAEGNIGKGDTVIYDRRGFLDESDEWEEVYGPDQPLTAGDIPVLDNGIARCRWLPDLKVFVLETYTLGAGWAEQARASIYTAATSSTFVRQDKLLSVRVLEWTPEKAVLQVVTSRYANALDRAETIVTLQRGWTGPRFEVYARHYPDAAIAAGDLPACAVRIVPNETGTRNWVTSVGVGKSDMDTWTGGPVPFTTASIENWFASYGTGTTVVTGRNLGSYPIAGAVVRTHESIVGVDDTESYTSGTRHAIQISGPRHATGDGYTSVHLGFGDGYQLTEAELFPTGGSSSSVADGTASGGNTLQSTRTTEGATGAFVVPRTGSFRVYARVRAQNNPAVLSIRAFSSLTLGAVKTLTNTTTYTWLDLGEIATSAALGLTIDMWRSSGTGNTYLDKVLIVSTEQRTAGVADYGGTRDVGANALAQIEATPELVAR